MTAALAPRGRDDAGAAMIAGVTLIFAFTFLGLVWLARDVDRGVANRSAAQSIAFQAARSGAQAVSVSDLRDGASVALDEAGARLAALDTASRLFASYGLRGQVTGIDIDRDTVTVDVVVHDGGVVVSGTGTVRAERTP